MTDIYKLIPSQGDCRGCHFDSDNGARCTAYTLSDELQRKYNCTQNDKAYIVVVNLKAILEKL